MTTSPLHQTTAGVAPAKSKRNQTEKPVLVLTVVTHTDLARIGERSVLGRGPIALSRAEPLFAQPDDRGGVPLMDAFISRQPLVLKRTAKGVRIDPEGTRTRLRLEGKPLQKATTVASERLVDGVVLALAERVALLLKLETPPLTKRSSLLGMVGAGSAMAGIYEEVARLADLEVPVLLRGETGTGKELLARAIHAVSPRKRRDLVSVNLGAIPPGIAAAELFGSLRGAFSGSVAAQDGFFRRAHGSTLFLDEIGEAPIEIQPMLLRVLESGEIYPLGSQRAVPVDVRLIAATDADLEAQGTSGAFKTPLYHRLAGYEIWVPPLRERREDIGRLFMTFARAVLAEMGETPPTGDEGPPWLPTELAARLCAFHWPGNMRQLGNVVRQLMIANRGREQLVSTPRIDQLLDASPELEPTRTDTNRRKPSTVTRDELLAALEANDYDLLATSRQIQVSRTSLYALIEQTPGLRIASDLARDEILDALARHNRDLQATAAALKVSVSGLRQRMVRLDVG